MVREEKCIVIDLDGTLCPVKGHDQEYEDLLPFEDMLAKLREYKAAGFYIILYTSRNMRTYGGNIGLINANTAKMTMAWLDRHHIPYDEIHFGKPWASRVGFYVDDRAVRPDEFLTMTQHEIEALLAPKEAQGLPGAAPHNGGTHPSSRDPAARSCACSLEAQGLPGAAPHNGGTHPSSRDPAASSCACSLEAKVSRA